MEGERGDDRDPLLPVLNDSFLELPLLCLYYPFKNLPATAGDVRDGRSIPGSVRSPGGGHDNPHQYSYLENPMDRVAKNQIQLKQLSIHVVHFFH